MLEFTIWDFIERLATDPQTTMALYLGEQDRIQDIMSEAQARVDAIDELVAENRAEKRRLNQMYQRGRCEQDYFDAEWTRLEREEEALGELTFTKKRTT